jgi:glucose-1-phosphate cytidylyltransferase
MKAVILAGGKGTRLGQYTSKVPKPMVKIGRFPILHHIIDIFLSVRGHSRYNRFTYCVYK